jgi:phenol hydroxylase P3 protein
MMMDYMLPNKVMSWAEAWECISRGRRRAVQGPGALWHPSAQARREATIGKDHISHQAWSIFYQYSQATNFHTWMPTDEELDWLSAKYPDTFDRYYRPRYEHWRELQAGRALLQPDAADAVPDLPDPAGLHRAG